ncbi:MAG TPA: hypothetical protein VGM80_11875 [Gaiellaceae bacterium]
MTNLTNKHLIGMLAAVVVASLLVVGVAAAASAPSVRTDSASSVSTTAAHLNGAVNPNGQATNWYFDFGTTTGYGTKTAVKSAGSGTKGVSVSTTISGLAGNTTYHYRIVASNGTGTALGGDKTLTTEGPPAVTTGGPQSVATTTVTLTGSVDPRGHSTNWNFDFGTSTAYGSKTPGHNAGSGFGGVGVSAAVTGLAPGVTYHYRLVASSGGGGATGSDATFTTTPAVTLNQTVFRVIAGKYVTLSGTVSGAGAGVPVTVNAQPFGAAAPSAVATVSTGGNGTWTYPAQPRIGTTYTATANGGTSASVTIGVQPALSFQRITKARFSTRVTGATGFSGKFVKFQRLVGDRWVTVKQARLNSNSAAIFPATLLPKGRSTIRVALSVNQAGPGYLGGLSRKLTYTRS